MPHQCVRCNTFYDDGASEILKGCKCGARLFFYIKKQHAEEAKKEVIKLNKDEKKEMEKDVYNLIGVDDPERPVVLDFESIRVLKPGKFELDLVHLFKNDPLVYKIEEGKYIIDIVKTFKQKLSK